MGSWYWIGVLAGVGVAIGLLSVGLFPRWIVAVPAALVAGAVGAAAFAGWDEAVAGLLGAVCGVLGAVPLVVGALRRGGTRVGLAAFVALGSLAVAAIAFIPVAGFLEAVALPGLGLRLRSREPERHAGLRTLARD
jgi:hypothetical protein